MFQEGLEVRIRSTTVYWALLQQLAGLKLQLRQKHTKLLQLFFSNYSPLFWHSFGPFFVVTASPLCCTSRHRIKYARRLIIKARQSCWMTQLSGLGVGLLLTAGMTGHLSPKQDLNLTIWCWVISLLFKQRMFSRHFTRVHTLRMRKLLHHPLQRSAVQGHSQC
jgi:hypothetical protein